MGFSMPVTAQDVKSATEEGAKPSDNTRPPPPRKSPLPRTQIKTYSRLKSQKKTPYRKLTHIFTENILETEVNETFSHHNVVELLAADSSYQWAKDITFRHPIWQLEFEFKPMRMIYVDIPQPSGRMQRKLIWYMTYTVKNTGKVLVPSQDKELSYAKELADKPKVYKIKEETKPIRFTPEFLLGSNRIKEGAGFTKSYPDRVIPLAVGVPFRCQVRTGNCSPR